MNSVLIVAQAFMDLGRERKMSLSRMKLNYLCYFAEGWSLGIRQRSLFDDEIIAWKSGILIQSLYNATKQWSMVLSFHSLFDEDEKFVRDLFEKYKHLSDYEISALAKEIGPPMSREFGFIRDQEIIPRSIIQSFFKTKLEMSRELGRDTPTTIPK